MPTPFFADLVREIAHEGGTGPLTPAGAVPGHRRFAGTVPPDTSFHYAIAGVARPEQWEVGLGRIGADGRLLRDTVSASSAAGARVDFAPGLKTIALTVGADWFGASDAAAATLAAELATVEEAVAARQPLSTLHGGATAGAADDLVTVRRGEGWVNLPLSALAYRDTAGTLQAGAPLAAVSGTAALPALTFAGDPDTGLFRPAADAVGFAAGGGERARLTATGFGIGVAAPYCRSETVGAANAATVAIGSDAGAASLGLELWGTVNALPAAQVRGFVGTGNSGIGTAGDLLIAPRTNASCSIRFLTGSTGPVERWRINAAGVLHPATDNAHDIGGASVRVKILYAATGTINTSDAREKSWRGGANAAELRAAARIGRALGFYRWNDAIAAKGAAARYHFGAEAQAVWTIMAEEGLVDAIDGDGRPGATPYAFLCWDAWDAADSRSAGDRFGLRIDQLALFLIAAQEQRLAALEAAA
jgi:hypothetical protein